MTLRPALLSPLLLTLLLVSWKTQAWAAPELIRVTRAELISSPRHEELVVVIEARVAGLSAESLGRCLAQTDRALRRELPPAASFRPVRWNSAELDSLRECSSAHCDYELPPALADRLARSPTLAAKQQAYFELAYALSLGDKKQKERRILPHQVKETCAAHDAFHWLLSGPIKRHDALVWRKFGPSKRMEPTLMTLQLARWRAGESLCLGKTLLFADHYYDDHLELYQLQAAEGGLELRYHSRSRFDFFDSWWARRFRGTIARGLRDYQRRQLIQQVTRCAGGDRPSAS